MTSAGELRRRALETLSRPSYSLTNKDMLLLNDNANLFGVNPAVEAVAEAFDFTRLWAYPSENSDVLRDRLASEYGVSSDEVIVGNGSDELLDVVCKTFINQCDVMCQPTPTFSMYKFYATVNLASIREKALLADFSLPVDAILGEEAKLIALCQPNNPTANLFDARDVGRVLCESDGIVLVDEAYGDFCASSALDAVLGCERGIDVRTFSKAYGIAGLRAGFSIARKELVDEMRRVRTPFGLNSFTEAVAVAALDNIKWMTEKVAEMKAERSYLAGKLNSLGFIVQASECNFLLCKSPVEGPGLVKDLRERGIAIRDCGAYPMLKDHVRVTIGPRPMMARFLEVLEPMVSKEMS
ncbi:MAG: histidinol-phosphate aminotransferase family protein [Methanobacteriota archaeon]|nr:MAG: histidinol-phosphate aminotransferase family protein [Euryarchaeota archaeon]